MMTHDEIVAEIQRRARKRGLLSHYCRDSRRCTGHPGFPDLVIAGRHGTVFLEVKTGDGKRTPAQTTWKYMLLSDGLVVLLVYERHLGNGVIDSTLDGISG